MARYQCERCGAWCNTLDEPHLCRDVARRLKRRERQVQSVVAILLARTKLDRGTVQVAAEDIVSTLARMGVAED